MTKENNTIPQFRVWNGKKWLEEWDFYISCYGEALLRTSLGMLNNLGKAGVCRFTGLFDKNNNPIYENDVLDVYSNEAKQYCQNYLDNHLKAVK